jgi:V/A-type H+-transporting ATPase subunit I
MDPTAALSPFFAIFFALCLTDAGYGFAIAAIFGTWLFISKKGIEEARLPWLLCLSGILAFFVGIPFGGWFGLNPAALPKALSFMTVVTEEGMRFRGQFWDLNAQSGINFLQNLALVLGITHLFFGMFLAGWHKWVHGKKAQAFWEHFTSHIVLGAVLTYVFVPEAWKQTAFYGLMFSLVLIVWGKGYGSAWYLRPIMGALGTVNLAIGLLSNVLSYLRILALGLVTGAMAMAVNQVATEMGKLFPIWIGIPVVILIALGGHTVSIALNTLGSFIHAGRLQFIEFFGQFFEGGGKPFTPFSRSTSSS